MAFSEGPDAGLALLDTLNLDASLGEYRLPQRPLDEASAHIGKKLE